jgi:MoaA/NifB/PqqE/SkfB family radical SAM enzyme
VFDSVQLDRLAPGKTIASLFLTPRCDMSCRFCASEAEFSVMRFDQARDLLRALRARSVANVVLGGGEPFLWPHDLLRLSALARELGFLVQVCTNGVSLPAHFERIESIDRYILPLESMSADRHNALRFQSAGHHEIVRERIDRLGGSGRELSVSTVVTSENLEDLPQIADHLVQVRRAGVAVHAWHLYRFLPVGRGGTRHSDRLGTDRRQFVQACAAVRHLDLGFPVYRRDNMLRSSSVEFFWYEEGGLRMGSQVMETLNPAAGGAG